MRTWKSIFAVESIRVFWRLITSAEGVVRLTNHELADHDRSRYLRGELTPLGQSGSVVLLEDVAAVEVAVLVEVVVD